MRTTFVNTLAEMARQDEKIVCVIGDTGFAVFEAFEKEFGPRFVNVGIAEQNFVGFGAGSAAVMPMARRGRPITRILTSP